MDDEDTECIHGLDPRWCGVCLHGPRKDAIAQREPERAGDRFTAGFEGHCPECDLPIKPGETIAKLTPSGRYVHGACVP